MASRRNHDQRLGDDWTHIKTFDVFRINNHGKIKIATTNLIKQFTGWSNNEAKVNLWMLHSKRAHFIVKVVHCRGIDHSDAHPTNATMFRGTDPSAEVTSVSNNALCVRQHLTGFLTQQLTTTLAFKQWKAESTFEFGQTLRQSRRGHTKRCRRFGEGFVISHRDQIGQLLNSEIEQRPLRGRRSVWGGHPGTLLLSLSLVNF